MIHEYRFSINGHSVNPSYSDDLTKEYATENGLKVLIESINGKIKLVGLDYDYVRYQAFNTKFVVLIEYLNNSTWEYFFEGEFYKTDCIWDDDNRSVDIKIKSNTLYDKLVNNLTNEVNILPLLPEIEKITYKSRPIIQLYMLGNTTISNVQNDSSWEQDVIEPVTSESVLLNTYKFAKASDIFDVSVTGSCTPDVTGGYAGQHHTNPAYNSDNKYRCEFILASGDCYIVDNVTNTILFEYLGGFINDPPYNFTAVATQYAIGSVQVSLTFNQIFGRYLLNSGTILGANTSNTPLIDIVPENNNYNFCSPLTEDSVVCTAKCDSTVQKFGVNDFKKYFYFPDVVNRYTPVIRNKWTNISMWFNYNAVDAEYDMSGSSDVILNDAYPIHSVISVLLNKFVPGLLFSNTAEHSEFFYSGQNPISFDEFSLFITHKTNVMTSGYDEEAKNITLTLNDIFTLLKNTFRCLWHVEGNKLRIENVVWYNNGGQYYGSMPYGADLTSYADSKNMKRLGFGQTKFSYDKPSIPQYMKFNWQDESEIFDGVVIEMLSPYATSGLTDKIQIGKFSADVDKVIADKNISKDGLLLLAAVHSNIINRFGSRVHMGYKVNYVNGVLVPDANYNTTEWINVDSNTQYYISNQCVIEYGGLLHQFVGGISKENSQLVFTPPPNAFFMRLSIETSMWESFTMSNSIHKYSLPIVDLVVNGIDVAAQNGFLSYVHLHDKFYKHDMPTSSLRINGSQTTAISIQRNKMQTVYLPFSMIELDKLIKTSLGNGFMDKISLNLSSRIAKATLRYETE